MYVDYPCGALHCKKPRGQVLTPVVCARCQNEVYCSNECLNLHKSLHRHACQEYKHVTRAHVRAALHSFFQPSGRVVSTVLPCKLPYGDPTQAVCLTVTVSTACASTTYQYLDILNGLFSGIAVISHTIKSYCPLTSALQTIDRDKSGPIDYQHLFFPHHPQNWRFIVNRNAAFPIIHLADWTQGDGWSGPGLDHGLHVCQTHDADADLLLNVSADRHETKVAGLGAFTLGFEAAVNSACRRYTAFVFAGGRSIFLYDWSARPFQSEPAGRTVLKHNLSQQLVVSSDLFVHSLNDVRPFDIDVDKHGVAQTVYFSCRASDPRHDHLSHDALAQLKPPLIHFIGQVDLVSRSIRFLATITVDCDQYAVQLAAKRVATGFVFHLYKLNARYGGPSPSAVYYMHDGATAISIVDHCPPYWISHEYLARDVSRATLLVHLEHLQTDVPIILQEFSGSVQCGESSDRRQQQKATPSIDVDAPRDPLLQQCDAAR